ncbi:MAG: NAD(P)-dependent oxidoreductase, partial [Bacteroides sp.]|nr:NAD(P)-dependent oxidoreductase [Bacteroides sp.]
SKIKAELCVMQSRIKHRVSLRQTFIMIPDIISLQDPIMFHQPINSYMECINVRDAGRLMVACLDQPDDSAFWGGYYNISGGPSCRIINYEFFCEMNERMGLRTERVMERNWYALKNFHMLFYEDADKLNNYLHHWEDGQSLEDYYALVMKEHPWYIKMTARICKVFPPYRKLIEKVTRNTMEKIALEPEGTLRWIREGDQPKIKAFFGSEEAYRAIPGWDKDMPPMDHKLPHKRLEHGYDESKEKLSREDLKEAAIFRGGVLQEAKWDGGMNIKVSWGCCLGHSFEMTPHAVLKGGHWCPECLVPPWKTIEIAKKNKFVAQLFEV